MAKQQQTRAKREISLIRRIIKKKCPTVSVRGGTGTVYGWAQIHSKDIGASFTKKEVKCLRGLGLEPGGNWDVIAPKDRKPFIERHMLKKVPKYAKYW